MVFIPVWELINDSPRAGYHPSIPSCYTAPAKYHGVRYKPRCAPASFALCYHSIASAMLCVAVPARVG